MEPGTRNALLLVSILFSTNVLHAQLQLSSANLAAIEATTPLPADGMPPIGTFYSAAEPNLPPAPGNFFELNGWSLGSGCYLLDDLNGNGTSGGFHALDDSGPAFPGSGGGGGGLTYYSPYNAPTNGLWLQITNISNGLVYAKLKGATDYVYEIYSTTNFALAAGAVSNWDVETEVFPSSQTNTMPFNVPLNGRNPLFLWARDWTGITSGGNATPEWWFYEYFGVVDLLDNDWDSQGNTLLSDYEDGIDPNLIEFSVSVTNLYVTAVAPIQLFISITAGEPFFVAALMDDTNFADAVWNPYTSPVVTVSPGSNPGWHKFYVGLRGLPEDATQTWQVQRLNVASPPVFALTSPTSLTVDEPTIQVYGYCSEPLAHIAYDVSNSLAVITNQPSEVIGQYYDTNVLGLTTNYFECLDVALTNGPNVLTLRGTDFAGDATATNFIFTLDYSSKTNAPLVQLSWPKNATEISATNVTFFGRVSDPLATVTATAVLPIAYTNYFPNGTFTNTYRASVARDGSFSLDDIPLNPGTNNFTITFVDAVGNTTATNISLVQTNFLLTVDPLTPDSQLWQATVNLTGEISDPTYAVWVNGVKGSNNGNGTWSANNVPVNPGGTAHFTATAYGPDEEQPDGSFGN